MTNFDYIAVAKKVLEIESALTKQIDHIDQAFVDACELCLECSGKLIVMGLGKSGHIADKIAATLSSTGTPSYFIHPSEAIHGDLGMIDEKDIVLIFSLILEKLRKSFHCFHISRRKKSRLLLLRKY